MTLTIELPPDQESTLKSRAEKAGLSTEDFVRQTLARALSELADAPEDFDADEPSLAELARDIVGEVPADELAKIPKDAAGQVDHYLYGHPKRYD